MSTTTTPNIKLSLHASNTPSSDASPTHTPYHVDSPDFSPAISPPAQDEADLDGHGHAADTKHKHKHEHEHDNTHKVKHSPITLAADTDTMDTMDTMDMAMAKPLRNVHLFENQVAGTLPMFHSHGVIYKPLKTQLERTFYKNIVQWLPAIEPFIPRYSGIKYLELDVDDTDNDHEHEHEHAAAVTVANNAWSQQMFKKNKHRIMKMPFLMLEDLTKSYRKPCILDLKIGTRHFAPYCKMDKMQRKLRKAWCSTCKDFGARIGGVQMYDPLTNKYRIVSKHTAMQFDKNEFVRQLQDFFTNSSRDGQHMHILTAFIAKLRKLMEILKAEHRFRWFSCSLLFVYEGSTKHTAQHEQDQEHKGEDEEHDEADALDQAQQPQPHDQHPQQEQEQEQDTEEGQGQALYDTNSAQQAAASAAGLEGIRNDLRLIDFTNFVIVEKYLAEIEKLQQAQEQTSGDEQDEEEADEPLMATAADDKCDDDDVDDHDDDEVLQLNKELDNLDEPDHGMLFGLDGIIKLLSELETTQCIKARGDVEWTLFTNNLLHSKMALVPFSNTDDFNEHTTIH